MGETVGCAYFYPSVRVSPIFFEPESEKQATINTIPGSNQNKGIDKGVDLGNLRLKDRGRSARGGSNFFSRSEISSEKITE